MNEKVKPNDPHLTHWWPLQVQRKSVTYCLFVCSFVC